MSVFGRATVEPMRFLLGEILCEPPKRFYAHLSEGLAEVLATERRLEGRGLHYKMGLIDKPRAGAVDCSQVVRLGGDDVIRRMIRL